MRVRWLCLPTRNAVSAIPGLLDFIIAEHLVEALFDGVAILVQHRRDLGGCHRSAVFMQRPEDCLADVRSVDLCGMPKDRPAARCLVERHRVFGLFNVTATDVEGREALAITSAVSAQPAKPSVPLMVSRGSSASILRV